MDKAEKYLKDLASDNPDVRGRATSELWDMWYQEAGDVAESRLREGIHLMEARRFHEAEKHFVGLVADYPEFPEGHNKLATILFLNGKYKGSLKECRVSLNLNPNHFGAWNGMGMCLYNLCKYDEAISAFAKALAIQPHAMANRQFIARCRGKLN